MNREETKMVRAICQEHAKGKVTTSKNAQPEEPKSNKTHHKALAQRDTTRNAGEPKRNEN
jgi:hypothetical protein